MNRKKLISKLKEAHALASQFKGGYSGEFLDAREFSSALGAAIEKLESGSNEVTKDLWIWFAPTCQWDDFVGSEGLWLGEWIHNELNRNRIKYGIDL